MDALMAALIAGALAQFGDRPAWLAAILADRWRAPGRVIAAAALALAAAGAIAVALAPLLAARITPEAAQLVLAVALLLQGGGVFPAKPPDRLDRWRLGAFATAAAGLFILCFGDGLQFVVLALAVRTPVPALAAAGATIGGLAVIAPAALIGERAWLRLPQRALRAGAAALFLLAGVVLGLGALRLV